MLLQYVTLHCGTRLTSDQLAAGTPREDLYLPWCVSKHKLQRRAAWLLNQLDHLHGQTPSSAASAAGAAVHGQTSSSAWSNVQQCMVKRPAVHGQTSSSAAGAAGPLTNRALAYFRTQYFTRCALQTRLACRQLNVLPAQWELDATGHGADAMHAQLQTQQALNLQPMKQEAGS
jgi:hypothetical protein